MMESARSTAGMLVQHGSSRERLTNRLYRLVQSDLQQWIGPAGIGVGVCGGGLAGIGWPARMEVGGLAHLGVGALDDICIALCLLSGNLGTTG